MTTSLRGFLYTPDSAAFNSGIIGGALPQFERFRAALERRTHAHYASVERRRGHAPRFVVDMLVSRLLTRHSSRRALGQAHGSPLDWYRLAGAE